MINAHLLALTHEDDLVMGITEGMFIASRFMNGVRMYPYVNIDGIYHYLEGEH